MPGNSKPGRRAKVAARRRGPRWLCETARHVLFRRHVSVAHFWLVPGARLSHSPAVLAATTDTLGGGEHFKTTRWSVVLLSAEGTSDDAKAREALAHLCRNYWRPVLAFICREGNSLDDAEDLTQEFFLMVLRGNFLRLASPARGRFRTLLLTSVKNFLRDVASKTESKKRGGKQQFISWDEWQAEAPSQLVIPALALEKWTAEQIFDVRWAATVAERALRRLQDECERRGRRRIFDALSDYLGSERGDISYEALAQSLGLQSADVKNLLHRLRQRYRRILREEIEDTVASAEDVEDELRYLVKALAAAT